MLLPQAFFLPARHGDRFCLFTPALGEIPKGAILYVHPFAEELNKTRRVVAQQVRAMALAGYSVLQLDLLGCGDSAGDFGDATWQAWVDDVLLAHAWLRERTDVPIWFWGLRSGCLLASSAAKVLEESLNFLFWQPVSEGAMVLQQFLRLAVIGEMLDGHGKGVMKELAACLTRGQGIEVAGYTLSPALAGGLESAKLAPPESRGGRLVLCETSGRETVELSPVSNLLQAQWQSAGFQVVAKCVAAPLFWLTQDANSAPGLISTTVALLNSEA